MRLKSLAALLAALVIACGTVPASAASTKHAATKQSTSVEKHKKHKHKTKHKHKEQTKKGKNATTLKSQKHKNV